MLYGPQGDGPADPAHGFEAVRFEMGDFVRAAINPFLEQIDEHNPLDTDIADVLRWRVPLLNKTPLELMGVPEQVPVPQWISWGSSAACRRTAMLEATWT